MATFTWPILCFVRIRHLSLVSGKCFFIFRSDIFLIKEQFQFNLDYDRAVDVRNDYKAANTCAKKDWKKFLADIASTCGVTIDYNSPTNPTVSETLFLLIIISIHLMKKKIFVEQKKFKKVKSDELKRVFVECANTIYEGKI